MKDVEQLKKAVADEDPELEQTRYLLAALGQQKGNIGAFPRASSAQSDDQAQLNFHQLMIISV